MLDVKAQKFRQTIEELKRIKGRHTELVTVYIPTGANLNKVVDQLRNEQSTAQNIKSKQVRKNVMAALEKIVAHLKVYRETPKLGLALFCGNISEKDGVDDIELFVVEPIEEVHVRMYQCDQYFVLEPLLEMVEEKELYGLVCLDGSEATIGLLKGRRIEVLKHMDSIVPGKTRKGGWSANRYARVREGILEDFLKKIAELASAEFLPYKDMKGVLVGGPGPIKDTWVESEHLNYAVKKKILGTVNTSYNGEIGLKEVVARSEDLIAQAAITKENKLLDRYFAELAKDTGLAAYGPRCLELLDKGVVDILIINDSYYREHASEMDALIQKANSMSTTVELISNDSPRGIQLRELGGIGAILRYKV